MKRSAACINSNRDTTASRSKRIRSTKATEEKENSIDLDKNFATFDRPNVIKKPAQHSKERPFNDGVSRENQLHVIGNTPSGSSISFSASPSSSTNTPLSINSNKKSTFSSNPTLQQRENNSKSTDRNANGTLPNQPVINASSQPTTFLNKNEGNKLKSFTQSSSSRNSFTSSQLPSLNVSTSSTTSNDSISFLVEGSLEYRELKRLYLKEKNQADEWRKDYQILKNQMTMLRATTIPRPSAEAVEWLREMFNLMNNHGAYVGDGRTLEQISAALGLDPTTLVSIAARTPQKSALKIFRLLYPTVASRAGCQSISTIPEEQLNDIYVYVRTLHRNLNFSLTEMRRAIGTSIRTAWSELRRMHVHQQQQQQQANQLANVNAFNPNAVDDLTEDGTSDVIDEDEDENNGNEQDEEDVNHLSIDNEDHEDEDDDD